MSATTTEAPKRKSLLLDKLCLGPKPDLSGQNPKVQQILHRLVAVTKQDLASKADQVDAATLSPMPQVRALAETGLLGLQVPKDRGGAGGGLGAGLIARLVLAAGCGVTNFVVLQHFFATRVMTRLLDKPSAPKLPEFSEMSDLDWLTGVCLGHLKNLGTPKLRVDFENDDIVFTGEAPWLTGWGMMRRVLIGGNQEDGRGVVVLADLDNHHGSIHVVSPYRLQVLAATNTVAPVFSEFRVPRSRLVAIIENPKDIDPGMPVHLEAAACSLGVAGAAAFRLHRRGKQRDDDTLVRAAEAFAHSLEDMWNRMWVLANDEEANLDERELCRAECNLLSNRTTFALLASEGGSADMIGNTSNRLYREAFAYILNAHTPSFRDALLMGLSRDL